MPLVIYGLGAYPQAYTFVDETFADESDFQKPGAHWPVAGTRLV